MVIIADFLGSIDLSLIIDPFAQLIWRWPHTIYIHHLSTFMANHPSTFFQRSEPAIILRTSLSLGVHDHANKRKKSRPAIVRHGNKLNAFRVKVSMISLPKIKERRASNISRTGVHCTTELDGKPQRPYDGDSHRYSQASRN